MIRQSRFAVCAVLAASLFSTAIAQAPQKPVRNVGVILRNHYDAAQRYQEQGNLSQAEDEYRLFVADALAEIAAGEAHLGEYAKAAPNFDEALDLVPNSPQLRLNYAQAAMAAGDLDHARTLARELIGEEAGNPNGLAEAHEVLGRTLLRMNLDSDARRELEAAMSLSPNFQNGYNLAIACLDLDDEKCADRLFTTMEATYGDTAALHMQFGLAWGESDFQPRAEEEFKKAIAEDPKYPEAHYCLAAVYLEQNEASKVPLAEKQLKEELAITPRDFLTWAALGKLAVSRRDYPEAEKDLATAIELNPKSPDAYLYQGQMYYNDSQSAKAEASLRKAIALTTDPSRNHYQIQKAYYLLGRLLMRQGKQQEAADQMKMAQKYLQSDLSRDKTRLSGMQGPQGLSDTSTTFALKDTDVHPDPEAVRQLQGFRKEIAPAVADSYDNLGVIAATDKDFATAASYFQSAAEWNPALPGLNKNWGRAAFAAARFGDAILPLSSYLTEHPEDRQMRQTLGISQFMTGNYRGCVTVLQPISADLESTPQVAFLYADALVKTGQRQAGVERLTALEKEHPDVPTVHIALGEAYLAGNQARKAVGELQTAVRLSPRNPQAHYYLGEALLAAGDAKSAVPELESAAKLTPQNPAYHRELARACKQDGKNAEAERETQLWHSLQPAPDETATDKSGAATNPN